MNANWKKEALTYIDEEGLFAPAPFPNGKWTGGNMLKDLGLFYVLLGKSGLLNDVDAQAFERTIESCYVPGYLGLLNRNPGRDDQQAHDDYVGIVAGSYFCSKVGGGDAAYTIANTNKIYRDNKIDGKIYWGGFFFRFIYVRPFFNLCNKKTLGWLDETILSLWFWLMSKNTPKDESGLILAWLVAQICLDSNTSSKQAKRWLDFVEAKYPGGWKRVFEVYYGEQHVFTKYHS